MKQLKLLLLLSLAMMYLSCSDSEEDQQPEPFTILTPCQYSFDFDGQNRSYVSDLNNQESDCSLTSSGDFERTFGTKITSISTPEIFEMEKGYIEFTTFPAIPTPAQLDSFFFIGMHDYAQFADNGVQITYTSIDGENWSTSFGSSEQNGSTFEIVEVVSDTIFNVYVMNLRVKFNCNLYNENGEVKTCEGTAILGMEAF